MSVSPPRSVRDTPACSCRFQISPQASRASAAATRFESGPSTLSVTTSAAFDWPNRSRCTRITL